MKNNEANAFVFIASIIIGILISTNIGFTRDTATVFLSAKQYQDAYNYKNKLYGEITGLMNQYDDYYTKLQKYKNNEENQSQIVSTINDELSENNLILGKTAVEGQGITIQLRDAPIEYMTNTLEDQLLVIHDLDIVHVINDLRNAGAEAISINGQRVIDKTEIYCSGAFLRVNGVKIAVPFSINAIGNKEVLYNYMMSNENYLKTLMMRKIRVDVREVDNTKIPAYIGDEKIKFMIRK
ncbi:DUF881 domain-containing protein [Clostridium sp. DJ247]|uniref:DUF881 domain-containing protein n=1 Tax=Clostridium sp. DJ247 TaxID=2726188 RepID=UPI00162A0AC1|nr:DUF881 domain-containing protein [Clostridium sp. DJ247]MBC2580648.1 DUF881 domain-containing protein [Clostridium sp. DJ247]MBC2580701.1 DUF881 domain-containing protein [Clostridium sp. DJ247]